MLHTGRNIISLVLSRVLSGVILFLIYTRLSQYLGTEATGQFGLLSSYVTVFNFLIDLGLSQLVIKKMSEDVSLIGKYLTNYFLIQLGLGLAFMLIMDGVVYFSEYPTHMKSALYVASLGLLLSSLNLPFKAVIIAMQRLTINAKVNFVNAFINAGLMGLAIYFRQDVFFLAFISVAVGVFDMIVYGYIVNTKFTGFKFDFDKKFIKQVVIWNTPFMILTLFSTYNRIDGLIVPYFRGFVENGYYAVAYKVWDTLAFFPGILGITLYPFFAHAISRGKLDEVRAGLETYTRYMIAVAVPMAAGAFILSEQITLKFFKAEFLPAAPALWLLVLAASILFIYTPANNLIISQLTSVATRVTGVTFFFNLTLNLILIPRYGFVAAAAVTAASELIQTIGYSYYIKTRIVKYHFVRHFIKPVIATLAMSAVIYLLRDQNVFLVIALGGVVYAIFLLILKFLQPSDWLLFKTALNFKKAVEPESTNI